MLSNQMSCYKSKCIRYVHRESILPAETCLHEAGIYLVCFSFVSLSLSHCLQHRKSGGPIISSEAEHNEVPQNLG